MPTSNSSSKHSKSQLEHETKLANESWAKKVYLYATMAVLFPLLEMLYFTLFFLLTLYLTPPLYRIIHVLYLTNMYLVIDGAPDWTGNNIFAKWCRNSKVNMWFRNLGFWDSSKEYFNAELIKTAPLPPSTNHLLCYHPHGIISMGLQVSLGMESLKFSTLYPGVNRHVATLVASFKIPLFREWILAHGFISCGSSTLKKVLTTPNSSVVLVPGGANEALYSRPGKFKVHLKGRKGFCRIALQTGSTVVPVVGFGENEVYDTVGNEGGGFGGWLYRWQVKLMKTFSFSFPIMTHILPRRERIVVVVGAPIGGGGEKIDDPTQEQIDELHGKYCEALEKLWNDHKDEYGKGVEFEIA
mmetsp:Transcript_11993/g.24513  ORF Transcript_11993/g.24513 Transcript_11993/m.24513 type:complete len:356 (+) Transcript_11993:101-1168(+)